MSEVAIRDEIASIMLGVSGVSIVHKYARWSSGWSNFLALFKDTNDKINGWMITRTAAPEKIIAYNERVHEYQIRGVYGLKDADGSELVFNALIEDICEEFRGNDTLNDTCNTTSPEFGALAGKTGMQVASIENRMFGNVLCHYCEIRLGAQVIETG